MLYILHNVKHSVYEIKFLKLNCLFVLLIWDQAFAFSVCLSNALYDD